MCPRPPTVVVPVAVGVEVTDADVSWVAARAQGELCSAGPPGSLHVIEMANRRPVDDTNAVRVPERAAPASAPASTRRVHRKHPTPGRRHPDAEGDPSQPLPPDRSAGPTQSSAITNTMQNSITSVPTRSVSR